MGSGKTQGRVTGNTTRERARLTLVLVQRILVLALLEQPIADLAHLFRDAQRDRRRLGDVLAFDGVLVFRVVLVHVAIGGHGLREGWVLGRELAAVHDDARLDGHVAARRLGVLDRADDGLAADDLAEDNVLAVEVRRRVAGDEELGAVCVRTGIRLLNSRG